MRLESHRKSCDGPGLGDLLILSRSFNVYLISVKTLKFKLRVKED